MLKQKFMPQIIYLMNRYNGFQNWVLMADHGHMVKLGKHVLLLKAIWFFQKN